MRASRILAVGAGLVALTVLAYAGVFWNDFVNFDDELYVTKNTNVMAGLNWYSWVYAWTTFDTGNWIPLTWLSLELDSTLFGVKPWAFHGTNLLLHAANVALLFWFLTRVTSQIALSAIFAALFAVHPLHVESVAWASERKDVLSTFWLLATLLIYTRYAERPSAGLYLAATLTFIAGLLSKSMLVTLPIVLLLLDAWPLGRVTGLKLGPTALTCPPRPLWRLLLEKAPWLLLSVIEGVVTIFAQGDSEAFTGTDRLPILYRLGNSAHAVGWYVWKTFWPSSLCIIYTHPLKELRWELAALGTLTFLAISAYVIIGTRQGRPWLAIGWLWYLVTLLPVVGLLQVGSQAYADRYSYVPQMGLLVILVWEAHYWLTRSSVGKSIAVDSHASLAPESRVDSSTGAIGGEGRGEGENKTAADTLPLTPSPSPRSVAASHGESLSGARGELNPASLTSKRMTLAGAAVGIVIVALLVVTTFQVRTWRNSDAIWRQAYRVDPRSWVVNFHLGTYLAEQGKIAEADKMLEVAVEQRPTWDVALSNLGWTQQKLGHFERARTLYEESLRQKPDQPKTLYNMVDLYLDLKDLPKASQTLALWLREHPEDTTERLRLGRLYARQGKIDQALAEFETVLRFESGNSAAHNNAGLSLSMLGRYPAAKTHLDRALQISPNFLDAHVNLAYVLEQLGDLPGAEQHYQTALKLKPGDPDAVDGLKRVQAKRKML
ncbi:Tfp pilus assembly protein PilF [Planctomicrobium piriforme]|uniref:Tfp pilus assembly protein PilF n=1 Tax=Planctomicrobium piriforme TaxID=1576369 RepID=A0A1I3K152_9PLAN|nr:Tfp pilus assembly protein PilF [Planctomicrobium piriforme]